MDIYVAIRKEAVMREVAITESDVIRIAGNLLQSGFKRKMDAVDRLMAVPIIARKLNALAGAEPQRKGPQKKTAEVVDATSNDESFELINQLVKANKCPKCSKGMTEAALIDLEDIKYCEGCRLSIWEDKT
jgi:hypothetical protein